MADFNSTFDSSNNGNGKPLEGLAAFDSVAPAAEYQPLPPGIYSARVQIGEYTTTKAGAEAYRMKFEITEGDHAGKTVSRMWTFGVKALPHTRRELLRFGLDNSASLLFPFPPPGTEYLVQLVVAIQSGDNGNQWNDIKRITDIRARTHPTADAQFDLPPLPPENATEGGNS